MGDSSLVSAPRDDVPVASASPRSLGWSLGTMLLAVLGFLLALTAMAAQPGLVGGPLLGLVGVVVAALSAVVLISGRRAWPGAPSRGVTLRELSIPLGVSVVLMVTVWLLLRAAVAGTLPAQSLTLSVAVPLLFGAFIVGCGATVQRLGLWSEPARGLWQRHGLWLSLITTAIYLPRLGGFGLIDPWETHYGEVAREMIARDDWVSLWWAQDGWFWSKPILNFWAQGLSFVALGVSAGSDEVIRGMAEGRLPQPEWAARLPMFLMTLVGQYLLYAGARAHAGRAAGFIGALVLVTMPYWYFLSHQSMADIVYVAPLTASMGLLLVALAADSSERVRSTEVVLWRGASGAKSVRVSPAHLLFFVILLLLLPQVIYLVSRNLSFEWNAGVVGFRWQLDRVLSGSPDNCSLPGNSACHTDRGASAARLQPALAAAIWAGAGLGLLWWKRHEDRLKRLCYLGAWLMACLSFMGKGAPGLVLVVFVFGGFLLARGRLAELLQAELGGFALLGVAVAAPWFAQELARHGAEFFERLFIHDMYKRAFDHVHDTNKGDDTSFRYYVWQLGYGLFPWSGIAAAATLSCVGRVLMPGASRPTGVRQSPSVEDLTIFMVLWQLAAFGMFSITGTKFHHYIFPLVPALAMLCGVSLAAHLGRADDRRSLTEPRVLACTGVGVLLCAYGMVRLMSGSVLGRVVAASDQTWPVALGAACLLVGVVVLVIAARIAGPAPSEPVSPAATSQAALGLGAAVLVGLAGWDLASTRQGGVEGAARLLQLFTYNYERPWPTTLDFRAVLSAFTLLAAGLSLMLVWRRRRGEAVMALCALAVICSTWGVNVYLVEIAPHWGQRETIGQYYRSRADASEPLVAYQLNWKGENFYTGNRVPAFVSSGKRFTQWVESEKDRGVAVMFFTTEHSRIAALKRELGKTQKFELLTDATLNNKFALARVVL